MALLAAGCGRDDHSWGPHAPMPSQLLGQLLPDAVLGHPYSWPLGVAQDDLKDPALELVDGVLPDGLVLDPLSLLLEGTPSEVGTFRFWIRLRNRGEWDVGPTSYEMAVKASSTEKGLREPPGPWVYRRRFGPDIQREGQR